LRFQEFDGIWFEFIRSLRISKSPNFELARLTLVIGLHGSGKGSFFQGCNAIVKLAVKRKVMFKFGFELSRAIHLLKIFKKKESDNFGRALSVVFLEVRSRVNVSLTSSTTLQTVSQQQIISSFSNYFRCLLNAGVSTVTDVIFVTSLCTQAVAKAALRNCK